MSETPLYALEHGVNNIYIKRDDLLPFSFGGNKARKAVLFFRQIDEGGYDAVVTYGSSSSNHCRVVSNMAAMRGLPCCIISPQEASEPTANSTMMELFGAKITTVPVDRVHDTIEEVLADLTARGYRPYFIPGGGHGNLGTQAYVECYEELRRYELAQGIRFDWIFFASGTGTTHAGLVCGQLLRGEKRKIVGISIARKNPRGRDVVVQSILDYLHACKAEVPPEEIEAATVFVDDYTGSGYGKDSPAVQETIRRMLLQHGIPMDSTYTAKAYTGMLNYIQKEGLQGQNILFLHTGGTPLFFDDLEKMKT